MFSRLAHFSLALALTAIPAAQGINITALFGPSLSKGAEIFLPTESDYAENVTQRWTLHDAPSYLGAIQVATEGDVQNIVCSKKFRLIEGMS